ncbi:MAG TPA: long-chain fatty acid--CoA ligase, partial [Rhizobiales bacterium]|nr:long-chain fatty acid--CoA ligase [Hyphomicrobiales bacterium]
MKKASVRKSGKSKSSIGEYAWLKHYPPGIEWRTEFKSEPLANILERSAEKFSDRVCTYFFGKTISYSEIGRLANRAAKGLQALGVGKGTRVGLLLPNCPAFVVYYFGILKTGATVVNCNPLYTVEELDHQIKDSETEFLVTLDLAALFEKADALLERGNLKTVVICPFADMLPPLKSILFRLLKSKLLADTENSGKPDRIVFERSVLDNDGAYARPEITPETDIAVLQYTGGTTGTPKGAMLTHANLTINIQQVDAWATNLDKEGEIILGVLPLFHIFAMTTVLNFGVARGFKMVLVPKFDI